MDYQLQGKRALVTGSSSGIGIGIAKALSGEGASVVVHGRNAERAQKTAEMIRAAGGKAAVAIGDLDTDEGADAVAKQALEAFGGIDILVNNAGGRSERAKSVAFFDIDDALWNETYNRNVTSTVRMIRRLVRPMKERGWGRVIQISSLSGQATSGGVPEYAATKTALVNLTLGMSKTLPNSGVTFNAISPGLIHTEALEGWLDMVAQQQGFGTDRDKATRWVLDNMVKQTVDRLGLPDDIGFTAAFLCSPRADFINGANIRVDGGAAPAIN